MADSSAELEAWRAIRRVLVPSQAPAAVADPHAVIAVLAQAAAGGICLQLGSQAALAYVEAELARLLLAGLGAVHGDPPEVPAT
jgi:hypothetical protein